MRRLTLREHETRRGVGLTVRQVEQLLALTTSIAISPSPGETDLFDLTPGSTVGALRLDDLEIVIEPKVPLDRLMFLLSYTLGRVREIEPAVGLVSAPDLPEAIVSAFVRQARRALRRGVQQGYRTVDESSLTLRGRLRVGDQIRRRYGPQPPAEVTFDEYTVDIELNRMLRAATDRLLRLPLRSERSRSGLRGIVARLEGVSPVLYDPLRLPEIRFDRLNERYRDAIALARLVLRTVSFDLGHGGVPATAFLVDMNRAFEDFVVEALRDALGRGQGTLVQGATGHPLFLDVDRLVSLKPDLSLWRDGRCVFVGDVKYKRVLPTEYANADIYQATAYAIATSLPGALLIYAAGEEAPPSVTVMNIGKRIDVVALDLSRPPAILLRQVALLAERIRSVSDSMRLRPVA